MIETPFMLDAELLAAIFARFDAENAQDPNRLEVDGESRPRELVQAERLERWLFRLEPEPSDALRIAARCQHLGRFRVPRASYPEGRIGYLTWRKDLAKFHADRAAAVLVEFGVDDELRERVRAIQTKQGLKTNPEVQTMEDALCLAFLEYEFVPFADKYDDEKIVTIVEKTWAKMSERGRSAALGLPLGGRALALVERALSRQP